MLETGTKAPDFTLPGEDGTTVVLVNVEGPALALFDGDEELAALPDNFGAAQWASKAVLPEERLIAVIDVFTSLKRDPAPPSVSSAQALAGRHGP